MNKIEIPLSKTKILLTLVGALMFVGVGSVYLFTNQMAQPEPYFPIGIKIIGLVSIVFFGTVAVYATRKLFEKKIGLLIDEQGITDRTNAVSLGLIEWADIFYIETVQMMSTKFLLIHVNNPQKYLKKSSGLKRKLIEGNLKMYGTPIAITSGTLKCNFKVLEQLIREKQNEYTRLRQSN